MRTQYYTAVSLDGFIATSDHSLEWLFALGDPEKSSYGEFIDNVGALAMGSSTYEWMLSYFATAKTDPAAAWPYTQPAWVFTTRNLPHIAGVDVRFVQGDVRPVHAAMCAAAQGKNLWIAGGGDLVGQFYDAGLLDDLILQIGSVILGTGQPLLPRAILAPKLKLVSVEQIGSAFVELRYEVTRNRA
jgi:dihydrofolate reductase